ncbi:MULTISPECIES: hypothetical protein [Pseudomonas]|uniref:Uncharacterized protein n=1 Tax=Pseudomonas fluorescens TaxID=294 RepID=A0A5E6QU74_PSEFL|nr:MULTISPECIES: hypothetical protein [Pseudomonas]VVM58730.1 hypothetical protein PS652_01177 [Pseudomonas fluorescens]
MQIGPLSNTLPTVTEKPAARDVSTSDFQSINSSGPKLGQAIHSLTDDVEDFSLELDKLFDELSRDMSPDELDIVRIIEGFVTNGDPSSNHPIAQMVTSSSTNHSTTTVEERVAVAEVFWNSIKNSDFLQNLGTSATVNMPSVFALTVLRGVVNNLISRNLSGPAAVAVGATFTAIPLLLAAGAFVHHELTGSATSASRASQLSLFAGAGLILAAAVFTNPVSIFSTIAKSAPGLMAYCIARDGFASVHNLGSDTALNGKAHGIGSVVYGLQQFIAEAVGLAMGPGWTATLVGALINAGIESGEPAVNETLSAWMSKVPVAQDVEAQHSVDDTSENHLRLDWKVPGWRDLLGRMEKVGIPRIIAFSIISTGSTVADNLLATTGLTDDQRKWIVAPIVGILAGLILTPFYHSTDRPVPNPASPPQSLDIGSGLDNSAFKFD